MTMDPLLFTQIFFFHLSLPRILPDLTVYMSYTVSVLQEAGTTYTSRAPEAPQFLVGPVLLIFLVFCVVILLCLSPCCVLSHDCLVYGLSMFDFPFTFVQRLFTCNVINSITVHSQMYSMPLCMITVVNEFKKVYDILWFIPTIKQNKHDKTELSMSYHFIFIVVESGFVIVLCVFPFSATLLISSYFLIFLLLSNHKCSN